MNDGAVLIVEDEVLILLDMEAALQEAGFAVVGAKNATDAIAAFDADPSRIKALISDIRLGNGQKSGWDVARHLRQTNSTNPSHLCQRRQCSRLGRGRRSEQHHDRQAVLHAADHYRRFKPAQPA